MRRDIREREQLLSASITVGTAGVPFQQTLKQEPWGAQTFCVADPDGNLVLFAGPV